MEVKNVLQKFLRSLSWYLLGIYPLMMIFFHILMCRINIFWGWLIELMWMSIYVPVIIAFLFKGKWGYVYLTLFFCVYQAREIYLGWLTFDYKWMMQCFLPGLFILALYINRARFSNLGKYEKVAPIGFLILFIIYGYFNINALLQENFGERSEWKVQATGKFTPIVSIPEEKDEPIIFGYFSNMGEEKEKYGYWNYRTGEFQAVENMRKGVVTRDGEWIYSYVWKTEEGNLGKKEGACYRYHIPSQTEELLFKANMDDLDSFSLSPQGDKLIFFEDTKPLFEERRKKVAFELIEVHVPMYKWQQETEVINDTRFDRYLSIGSHSVYRWIPNGEGIIVCPSWKKTLDICTPEGEIIEEIPILEEFYGEMGDWQPFGPEIQISSNSRYILAKNKKWQMYVYDREKKENGWLKIENGWAEKEYITGDSTIVFNQSMIIFDELYREWGAGKGLKNYGVYIYDAKKNKVIRLTNNYDEPLDISEDGKRIFLLRRHVEIIPEVLKVLNLYDTFKPIVEKFDFKNRDRELIILERK